MLNTSATLSGPRLASKYGKVRTGPQTSFRLCRLPVRPERGQGQTYPRQVADTDNKNQRLINWAHLPGPAANIPHRALDSNRKIGSPRSTSYEAHTVTPQTKLEGTRITRKGNISSQAAPPPSKMVAGGKQCAPSSIITPTKSCSAIVYRCIKRRLGAHLNNHTATGTWSLPESKLHINYLERETVFLALKEFQDLCQNNIVLIATDNTTVVAYVNNSKMVGCAVNVDTSFAQ